MEDISSVNGVRANLLCLCFRYLPPVVRVLPGVINHCLYQWLYRWMVCVRLRARKGRVFANCTRLHLMLKFITFGVVGRARLHHGPISSSTFRSLFEAKWYLSALREVRENRRDILWRQKASQTSPDSVRSCCIVRATTFKTSVAANNLTNTDLDFETLVNKFKRYFSSRNNVVFERYEFRRYAQEPMHEWTPSPAWF